GARSVCLVAPTGAGKTVVLSRMTQMAAERENRVLILVHRKELLDQISSTLGMFGVGHSLVAPGHKMTYAQVQAGSVQTVAKRLDMLPPFTWIVVDECHHVAGKNAWATVINHFETAKVLGVTATPCRLDGRGLGNHFDQLVMGPQIADLIAEGFLCKPRVLAPPSQIDVKGLKFAQGDFARTDLKERSAAITGDVVQEYLKHATGKL